MSHRYPITLEPDEGTLLVSCPLLPEVVSYGDDEADALAHALDAVEEALAARIDDGEDIPAPPKSIRGHSVLLPVTTALKVELYRALRESGMTRAELMRRLGWNRESVDRLFRLDHESRPAQIEAALRALGRTVTIKVEKAA